MGTVLLVAIVVGIFFGYLAGIALALGVLTIFLLGFGWSAGVEMEANWGRYSGEKLVRLRRRQAPEALAPSFTRRA